MVKKAAIITGGSSVLGRSIALYLNQLGYEIIIHYFQNASDAQNIQDMIQATGGKCHLWQADFTQPFAFYSQSLLTILENIPYVSLLVNNAAAFNKSRFIDTEENLYDLHMNVNIKAPFFLSQLFAKKIKAGQIINIIDSYISKQRSPYFTYLMSKKLLADFTQMAAHSLGPEIRVNGICPGLYEGSEGLEAAFINRKKTELPLRRLMKDIDIHQALNYLLENDYMTGQILYIDGGEQLR